MANTPKVNSDGFTVLYEASSPTIDVVFVHGFTGHPRRTWTFEIGKHGRDEEPADEVQRPTKRRNALFSRGNSIASSRATTTPPTSQMQQSQVFWPQDLLPQSVPQSRVLTYGYDTNIKFRGQVSQNSVYQHAWDFLIALAALREDTNRPILFIAHSLGGIVVKEALRRSRGAADAAATAYLRTIFDTTAGVIFFGTPHRGADPRSFIHHVAQAALEFLGAKVNEQIVNTLMPNAERLAELNDDFPQMCRQRRWVVHSFQEQIGVGALLGKKVVEDTSSCLDDLTLEIKQHIRRNHMDMCRFGSLQDPGYVKAVNAIARILKAADGTRPLGPDQILPHAATRGDSVQGSSRQQQQPPSALNSVPSQPMQAQLPNLAIRPNAEAEQTRPLDFSTRHTLHADVRQALIDNLNFEQIDERLTGLAPAFNSTCRWFFDTDEYQTWRDGSQASGGSGFLWIKGHPGTGKSTLMKVLFERGITNARGDPHQICLSFFFNARGVEEEQSTTGLYRSLLHQLFQKSDQLKKGLEWMTIDGAKGIAKNGWHEQALKQTLVHAIEHLGNHSLIIFVDALDECDDKQAVNMVSHFEELCDHARDLQLRLQICFSSRHYPELSVHNAIEITLEDEEDHRKDIASFIRAKLKIGSSKNADDLRNQILTKSSQIFLWVVLVIDIINTEFRNPSGPASIKKIQDRVHDIPPRLHELFEMILERDGENLEQLRICLNVILFALRPLDPQELYFAVQLGLDPACSTSWDRDDIEYDQIKRFVRSSSKGLAEVTRHKKAKVQFIHESVRDFLLGRYGTQWSGATGNIKDLKGKGHELLRDCCSAQLQGRIDGIPDPLPRASQMKDTRQAIRTIYPFLEYSVLHLFKHANQAQGYGLRQHTFLDQFPLARWVDLNNVIEPYGERRYSKSVSLVYVLAAMDSGHLIASDPQAGHLCFAIEREKYGTPLFAAACTRSENAVQALVEAQLQIMPAHFLQLQELCRQLNQRKDKLARHDVWFEFSPKKDIAAQIQCHWGGVVIAVSVLHIWNRNYPPAEQDICRALEAAAQSRQQAILPVVLEAAAGFEWNAQQYGGLALRGAVKHGHEELVKLLLDRGVDVDSRELGGHRATPLWLAANKEHDTILQLLLNANANVDVRDAYGDTPLVIASRLSHENGVKQLLAAGANTELRGRYGATPLSEAAYREKSASLATMKLLLDANANTETKNGGGMTPLCLAIRFGGENRHQKVQLLLDKGACVDATDDIGRTPLAMAVELEDQEMVALLRSHL